MGGECTELGGSVLRESLVKMFDVRELSFGEEGMKVKYAGINVKWVLMGCFCQNTHQIGNFLCFR